MQNYRAKIKKKDVTANTYDLRPRGTSGHG